MPNILPSFSIHKNGPYSGPGGHRFLFSGLLSCPLNRFRCPPPFLSCPDCRRDRDGPSDSAEEGPTGEEVEEEKEEVEEEHFNSVTWWCPARLCDYGHTVRSFGQ